MDVSKLLSRAIGIYLVIINLAMLMNMPDFISAINGIINNNSLLFTLGLVTLFIGSMLVVSHNIWTWNWRILVTLMAWITLIKGATILFCPDYSMKTTLLLIENSSTAYVAAGIDLVLGLVLCYFGFRKQQ